MSAQGSIATKRTNVRWFPILIFVLLATTINYLDRSIFGIARAAGVDHVAISLGGWDILHATGAVWSVTRNSLDPASPVYRRSLAESYLGARRFRCD